MAGKYRHRITIEKDTGTSEGSYYDVQESWGTLGEAWAEIDSGGSRRYYAAQQVHPELTHLVTIPYRSDVAVTQKLRIVWGTRYLYPLGPPVDAKGLHREWEFRCAEQVA